MRTNNALIIASLTALLIGLHCTPSPREGDSEMLTRETVERRWAQTALEEKFRWAQRGSGSGKAAFEEALREEYAWRQLAVREGVDELPDVTVMREEATNGILFGELVRHRAVHQLIAEADLVEYYQQHMEEFFVPEEVEAAHILVTPRDEPGLPNESGADAIGVEAARDKAEAILARLEAGEDFGRLAEQLSEDSSAKRQGHIGWFARGTMIDEFETAAFALEPGGTSKVVRTDYGFHVIRVLAKRGGTYFPLEEVRRNIEDAILARHRDEVEQIRVGLRKEMEDVLSKRAGDRAISR